MKTFTPRDSSGKFEAWGSRVEGAGSYTGQDAVVAVLAMAAGAAIWELGKWAWGKLTSDSLQ